MKNFSQFGVPLTRGEAKEIRGGQDYIEKPVTDPTDGGSGGGSGGACPTHNLSQCIGQECTATTPSGAVVTGTCIAWNGFCVCSA